MVTANPKHARPRDLGVILQQITESLSGEVEVELLLEQVLTAARQLTGAQYAALGVLGPEGDKLMRFLHQGLDQEIVEQIGALPTGGGLLGELIRHPAPLMVHDLASHPAFQGFPDHHPPMGDFIGVPIRAGGRVFGNLYLTDAPTPFSDIDLRNVSILAAHAGVAIHTAELARRLRINAVQSERERISRDLHDGVIQSLFSVGMGLEAAKALIGQDEDRLRSRIDGAVDQLDTTIREIRNTIFTLKPATPADLSLQTGLLELAKEYEGHQILTPSLNVSQSLDTHVPEGIVPDILNIVREALSNVARHARNEAVLLDARVTKGDLVLVVRDRGPGFDPATIRRGNGLDNMQERATLLNADLSIHSRPGEGTTLVLTVPLDGMPASTA